MILVILLLVSFEDRQPAKQALIFSCEKNRILLLFLMVSLLLDLLALTPRWTMSPGLSDSRLQRCFYWGCGGRFGQSKELSAFFKSFSSKQTRGWAAQSAFFLRLSDPRGVDHEAVRRSRGCTVPILLLVYAACVYASLLRGNSINAAADAQWFQIAKTRQNFNFENSWNWRIILTSETIWQVLNLKCSHSETEVL